MNVPRQEIAERVERVRRHLKERSLKSAIIVDPLNFAYLCGFHLDVDTWERPVALLIFTEAPTLAIVNELSSHAWRLAQAEGLVVVDRVTIYREHTRVPCDEPSLPQWADLVGRAVQDAGASQSLSSDRPVALQGMMDVGDIASIEAAVRDMRLLKSAAELAILRRTGVITDWAQERYRRLLRPGRHIQEVDHEVAKLLEIRASDEFPKSHFRLLVISFTGPDSAYPHGKCGWPAAKIERGHAAITNIAFRIDGLGVENERVWSVGIPEARFREAFEVTRTAQHAGVSACVAGRQFAEIDAAAQAVISEAGLGDYSLHRAGHGVGLGVHEYPSDTAFNRQMMKGGEIMAVEPGIYIPGLGGFRHSDTLVVGQTGPELLTRFPRDLEALTVT